MIYITNLFYFVFFFSKKSGNDGEKIALNQGFTRKATVFLKGNNNCEFNVDKPCTKVLIG